MAFPSTLRNDINNKFKNLKIILFAFLFMLALNIECSIKFNKEVKMSDEAIAEETLMKHRSLYYPIYDFSKKENEKINNSKEFFIKAMLENGTSQDYEVLNNSYIIDYNSPEYKIMEEDYMKQYISKNIIRELKKNDKHKMLKNDFFFESDIYVFPKVSALKKKNFYTSTPYEKLHDFSAYKTRIRFDRKDAFRTEKPTFIPIFENLEIWAYQEPMTIIDVSTDIHQVLVNVKNIESSDEHQFPQEITNTRPLVLQIFGLADYEGVFEGNIYITLKDLTIIIVPYTLVSLVPNPFGLSAIYYNIIGSKELKVQIEFTNPYEDKLIVKSIFHSLTSVSVTWPNGKKIEASENNDFSAENLEIPAMSKKVIAHVHCFKEVDDFEYGWIRFKTDKHTVLIPVMIKVRMHPFSLEPSYFNFGLIDVGTSTNDLVNKIKRVFPIRITNEINESIQIKYIYMEANESMLKFHLSDNYRFCNIDLNKDKSEYKNSSNLSSMVKTRLCIINKTAHKDLIGYLVINPMDYYNEKSDHSFNLLDKEYTRKIFIETTDDKKPILKYVYKYTLTSNLFNIEDSKLEFENENLDSKRKLSLTSNYYFKVLNETDETKENLYNLKLTPISREIHDYDKLIVNYDAEILKQNTKKYQYHSNSILYFKLIYEPYEFSSNSNEKMAAILPFKIYDNDLQLVYCKAMKDLVNCLDSKQYLNYNKINLKSKSLTLDLGIIADSELEPLYIFILNDRPKQKIIDNFTSNNKNVKITLENIGYFNETKDRLISDKITQQKIIEKQMNKQSGKTQIKIESDMILRFVINISRTENELNSKIVFEFSDTKKDEIIRFEILIKAKFVVGTLSVSPNYLRFDPSFPGLIQSKHITAKSSFGNNVNIKSVSSDDPRIKVTFINKKIYNTNRSDIIRVDFDPSNSDWEENFMIGNFTLDYNKYLTYKELYWWMQKQKAWEIIGNQGKTEIKANIHIRTDIKNDIIQVSGSLNKPSLVKKDEIDFKLIQIGEQVSRFIEVINESDEYLSFQIILAPENFSDINNINIFTENGVKITQNKNICIMDCYMLIDKSVNSFRNIHFSEHRSTLEELKFEQSGQKNPRKKDEKKPKLELSRIIINEELTEKKFRNLDKNTVLNYMFKYASHIDKVGMISSYNYLCKNYFINKNEAIYQNDAEMINNIFSSKFDDEIPIVTKMTESNHKKRRDNYNNDNEYTNLFDYIVYYLKLLFINEEEDNSFDNSSREVSNNDAINNSNSTTFVNNEFYFKKSILNQVIVVKPKQKAKIGPIFYSPTDFKESRATLFIKNNLTILYPVLLKGQGGSGLLNFYNVNKFNKEPDFKINERIIIDINRHTIFQLLNNKKEIDENIIQNMDWRALLRIKDLELIKTIKIKNEGDLPIKILNIAINNQECEAFGIKILDCSGIVLKSMESNLLNFSIKPDFNFYYLEKDVTFIMTPNKSISISICINISSEILDEKNNLFNNDFQNEGFYLIFVIGIIILIIIKSTLKERYEVKQNNFDRVLEIINHKEELKTNAMLQFDYLFIKASRNTNEDINIFFNEQFDIPGAYDESNFNMFIGKRKKNKNIYHQNKIAKDEEKNEGKNLDQNNNKKEKLTDKNDVKKVIIDETIKKKVNENKKKISIDLNNEKNKSDFIDVKKDQDLNKKVIGTKKLKDNDTTNKNIINTHAKKNLKDAEKMFPYNVANIGNGNISNSTNNTKVNDQGNLITDNDILKRIINTSKPYIPKNNYHKTDSNLSNTDNNMNIQVNNYNDTKDSEKTENIERIINDNLDFNKHSIDDHTYDTQENKNIFILNDKHDEEDRISENENLNDEVNYEKRKELLGNLNLDYDDYTHDLNNKNNDENLQNVKVDDERKVEVKFNVKNEEENTLKNKFANFTKILKKAPSFEVEQNVEENESDEDNSKYHSEAHQIAESGTEDYFNKFNFQSIFGRDDNMKINNYNVNDEEEENNEKTDYSYKGFSGFNNNSGKKGFKAFSLNPFDDDDEDEEDDKNHLLQNLEDEDSEDEKIDPKSKYDDEKLNDLNEQDDEEDPEWVNENDYNKGGYFEVTGDFKLK